MNKILLKMLMKEIIPILNFLTGLMIQLFLCRNLGQGRYNADHRH
ncbi:MAG: hypothetical protein M5T52_22510 [Ignavibacteriaceae bacterium]|nr:hypothetical protein [Ignavibacteriaceae bacterium]